MARVQQPVREIAVVREQEESLGVAVETTDREHARPGREVPGEVDLGVAVGGRARHARGLVEREVPEIGVEAHADAVDGDAVAPRIDLVPQDRDPPVERDPSPADQVLARAPRSDARACERPLEALLRHRTVSRLRRPRPRPGAGDGRQRARLDADPEPRPLLRHRLHRREPAGRSQLRLDRSAHSVWMSNE